jgi:hypothetical protein
VGEPLDVTVLDPERSTFMLLVGTKGSGKSHHAAWMYRTWPGNKLVLDVTGDAEAGPDAEELRAPLPPKFPRSDDGRPRNLRIRLDRTSPTYQDDLDRAVRMALYPRDDPVLFWADEVAELGDANTTRPHWSVALWEGRHYRLSILACGPRPQRINPLVVSQADLVAIYRVPNPRDRQRLAENMGYPPARLEAELAETYRRGPYWHLLYDARPNPPQLYRMPPLPPLPKPPPEAAT